MDLKIYNLEDLILTALKAEDESKSIYSKLAGKVDNYLLKERFIFLANEESKHYQIFEKIYEQDFPNKTIKLPKENPVPLPQINLSNENIPISQILQDAMNAEINAHDFYLGIADRYNNKPQIKNMLLYIAKMELGHYRLIEIEKENAEKFEGFNIEFPLMHVGP